MSNAETIMQYCRRVNMPVTAKQILDARFPGKPQPYINSTINDLVQNKKLVRNDEVRPYTVRLPMDGEVIPEPKDYSRSNRSVPTKTWSGIEVPCTRFTKEELDETAKRVNRDPRYGEEGAIINSCLNNLLLTTSKLRQNPLKVYENLPCLLFNSAFRLCFTALIINRQKT